MSWPQFNPHDDDLPDHKEKLMADTTQQATAPGLEIMAQRLFEMPYAELSPRLQIFIRRQVAKDAAEDLLEALKKTIPLLQAAQRKGLLDEVLAVIETAEGR